MIVVAGSRNPTQKHTSSATSPAAHSKRFRRARCILIRPISTFTQAMACSSSNSVAQKPCVGMSWCRLMNGTSNVTVIIAQSTSSTREICQINRSTRLFNTTPRRASISIRRTATSPLSHHLTNEPRKTPVMRVIMPSHQTCESSKPQEQGRPSSWPSIRAIGPCPRSLSPQAARLGHLCRYGNIAKRVS